MSDMDKTIDVLTEAINIGAGKAADALNRLFSTHIDLRVPVVTILQATAMPTTPPPAPAQGLRVRMNFQGEVSGMAQLELDYTSAQPLLTLLGQHLPPRGMDELARAIFSEMSNIIVNAIIGAISNLVQAKVSYALPIIESLDTPPTTPDATRGLAVQALVSFSFSSSDCVVPTTVWFTESRFANTIFQHLNVLPHGSDEEPRL
jgi:chemotaxis protein CheY-P-specific phosphatase CheC